jgi:phage terminase large subunit-like protein
MLADLARSLVEALEYDWRAVARPEQLAPAGDWSTWLFMAGRGAGKTRAAAEWIRESVCGSTPLGSGRYKQLALVGETAADVRDTMVGDGKGPGEGSGLLQVHPKDFLPIYEPSKRRLTWPNGAIATLYNATEPDQLRGPQHDASWCDELAKWKYAEATWDMLQFGLRLGRDPRCVITTTPRPTKLLKSIMADPGTVITQGSTFDNRANLAASFLATILRRYEGTRLGRQELNAEILEDVEGALWTRAMIEAARIGAGDVPTLRRIVVAIDPAVSCGEDSDETGIIVAGLGADDCGYLLEDLSGRYQPHEWASIAVRAYHRHKADRIVAEVNQGGAMVEATVRVVDPNVPYKAVHASRGKIARAEPVSALYEQNRIHHAGAFPALEAQLCEFAPGATSSPDRLDAAVWAFTELMLSGGDGTGIIEFYRRLSLENPSNPARAIEGKALPMVRLLAAADAAGTLYLASGRCVNVPESREIEATPEDAKSLLLTGWTRAEEKEQANGG